MGVGPLPIYTNGGTVMRKKAAILILLTILAGIPINQMPKAKAGETITVIDITPMSSQSELTTKKQVTDAIRKGLLNREKRIQVKMKYSVMQKFKDVNEFLAEAKQKDDKSTAKDADYLQFSIRQWHIKASYIEGHDATVTLDIDYKNTNEEEKMLDEKVKSALLSLELEGKSEDQKVQAIHDYIINNVSYDTSLRKTSAYDALINQAAVCEGYAMAAYRMFTEAGLESRIITGRGNGGSHAWNIVQVEGKWYNIDLTWDDPLTEDGSPILNYDYFLKSTKDFTGHSRDAKYKTEDFLKTYPISDTSYASNR